MAAVWPRVGDPCLGFERAPDCPAIDHPLGPDHPVYCTRDTGHEMPHVADGQEEIVHVWVGDDDLLTVAQAHPVKTREVLSWLLSDPDDGRRADEIADLYRRGIVRAPAEPVPFALTLSGYAATMPHGGWESGTCAAPVASDSECITGKPCRMHCSLFCALED